MSRPKNQQDHDRYIGYVRASVADPDNQRQIEQLIESGVAAAEIFQDGVTNLHEDRPGWMACWQMLRSNDVLVVQSLDRLGRDIGEIMRTIAAWDDKPVNLWVLNLALDTRTPAGREVFQMFIALARCERELTLERSIFRQQKARSNGVLGGSPKTYIDAQIIDAMRKTNNNYEKAGKLIGASRITMIRRWKMIKATSDTAQSNEQTGRSTHG